MSEQGEEALQSVGEDSTSKKPVQSMRFHQLFALPQASQGSIFTFSPFVSDWKLGCYSFLMATLNAKFTIAGFLPPASRNEGSAGRKLPWEPQMQELHFSEIGPQLTRERTLEVYSLHVFQRSNGHQTFIGVSFGCLRRTFDPSSLIRTRTPNLMRIDSTLFQPSTSASTSVSISRLESTAEDHVADHQTKSPGSTAAPNRSQPATPTGNSSSHVSNDFYAFHIYGSRLINKEDCPEKQVVAASTNLIFRQQLPFLPTHLTSLTEKRCFDRPTFLLGGADGSVSVFVHQSQMDFADKIPMFVHISEDNEQFWSIYPEYSTSHLSQVRSSHGVTDSPVTWIAHNVMKQTNEQAASSKQTGVTAIGHREGSVIVTFVELNFMTETATVEASLLLSHFGPVFSIVLFEDGFKEENDVESPNPVVSMLVCPSLEPCLVYRLQQSDDRQSVTQHRVCELSLPSSSNSGAPPTALSATLADVDLDGSSEILIGCCDKSVAVFKRSGLCWQLFPEATAALSQHSPALVLAMLYAPILQGSRDENGMALALQQAMSYIILYTTYGLLVLQHDFEVAMELCKKRLQMKVVNDCRHIEETINEQ